MTTNILRYTEDIRISRDQLAMHRKKVTLINAYESPPNVSAAKTSGGRPKNFRVRVYRNGDDSVCAYCASCSIDIILAEATRKLQMIRPAQRLFDYRGQEIFRSEDIHRDMEYYVSEGEDFISPLETIKSRIQYRLHSKWTLVGIRSSYKIKPPRRVRRPRPKEDTDYEELIDYEEDPVIKHDNKHTQTTVICESKDVQTDEKPSVQSRAIQTVTTKYDSKGVQADGRISSQHRDTQTMTKYDEKGVQTDGKTSIDNKDTQTIIQLEDKNTQADHKTPFETKDTQTTTTSTRCDSVETQTETLMRPSSGEKESDPTTDGGKGPDPTTPGGKESDATTPDGKGSDPTTPGGTGQDPTAPGGKGPDPTTPGGKGPDPTTDGGKGPDSTTPGGKGPDPTTTGGKGADSTTPGGKGSDATTPDGKGSDPTTPGGKGPDSTTTGGKGPDPTTPGGKGPDPTTTGGKGPDPTTPDGKGSDPTTTGEKGPHPTTPGGKGSDPTTTGGKGPDSTTPGGKGSDPTTPGGKGSAPTPSGSTRQNSIPRDPSPRPSSSDGTRRNLPSYEGPGSSSAGPNEWKPKQQQWDFMNSRERAAAVVISSPLYSRPNTPTNFRVRVYRNGEHSRYAYCKSCSMDIILSAATEKLQMPMPARRLFNENGSEIFHSRDIRRDSEYYVSSSENFKKPLKKATYS